MWEKYICLLVSWVGEQFHVIFDLRLCSTCTQCEYTTVVQSECDKLGARVHRQNLIQGREKEE